MGITTETAGPSRVRPRHVGSALTPAAIGIVLAMVLIVVVDSTQFADARWALPLSYLCVWIPLLGAIVVAGWAHGASFWRWLRFSVRGIDLIWGLGVGLLARTVASLIEILGYGSIGSAGVRLGDTVYDAWWLFGALLAPVLLAPIIEELFFRGLVLRAVYGRVAARWAAPIAIAVSGLTFALMHLVALDLSDLATVAVVGSSTLIFGLAAASLSLATGRIGGAMIAHVTFNALVIVPALL
ncbi:CPBP family intramembrane glutamic endopeptidase [Cryobacterium sp. N21]|uniref:CPBP family intramembrane glutamic endopeptidase n=1 Tax=Cryobacterium sp. N21 TaxID=2048289 RepID=UPI000CE31537|nr:CPBP family glutamic-type intramembrane protease [Cryobacterium sp. N21]